MIFFSLTAPECTFALSLTADDTSHINSFLIQTCSTIDEECTAQFHISGFGETQWPVNVYPDLCILFEQLPYFLPWLIAGKEEIFDLKFYEQGFEKMFRFARDGENINVKCFPYGPKPLQPHMAIIEMTTSAALTEQMLQVTQAYLQILGSHLETPAVLAMTRKWLAPITALGVRLI